MKRYVLDDFGEVSMYDTEAAFRQMERALDRERQNAITEGWPEDVDVRVYVAKVIHHLEKTNVRLRPDDSQLDEDGYDEDGVCWNDIDGMCDYKIVGDDN